MTWIKFLEDYQCCWKKGEIGEVSEQFAYAMIERDIAKAIDKPVKDKMISGSPKNKAIHTQ